MSGFQVWNAAGALTIDSNFRHTTVTRQWTPGIIDVGAYNASLPFGNLSALGYLNPVEYPTPNQLYWVRLNAGAWCIPGAWMFQPGTFQFISTSRVTALQTGILDVYDATGALIWDAKSAQDMPRTQTVLNITSAPDNVIQSVRPGFSPWFLMGACPGNVDDDGETLAYSGLTVQWTGIEFRWAWIRRLQKTFDQVFSGKGGVRIPLATFTGR